MNTVATPTHPPAVAAEILLYHVVHPALPDLDEWTQDYTRAAAICARFVRDYGGVHLHAETHQAGQYEARCLVRTETTDCMDVQQGREQTVTIDPVDR
jgi:hypothetical protein